MRSLVPKTVFGRAFLVVFVAGIAAQVTLIVFAHGSGPQRRDGPLFWSRMAFIVDSALERLAAEPTLENAERLLGPIGLDVETAGAVRFATRGMIVDTSSDRTFDDGSGAQATVRRGRAVIRRSRLTPRGAITFTFLGPTPPANEGPTARLIYLAVVLFSVFVAAAYFMHRILRPLGALAAAFDKVKRGDTGVTVPSRGDDEVGRLARSFNEMAKSIRYLIEDKEQLFLELSHEFRAPIARASAANALAEDDELRNEVQRNLSELDALIHALLTAAKLEAGGSLGKVEAVAVEEVIAAARAMFPDGGARIEVDVEAEDLACRADNRSVLMLLRNLLENSLKYSPPEKPVRVRARASGDFVELVVRDEGKGIPSDELPRLFEPFFRGGDGEKLRRPGFGLGLALCRRLARAHGGELGVESVPGEGTTVTVRLPIYREGREDERPALVA